MAKLIVTAAPPTSNGDLHLGHISGPYLSADVFTRVRRQLGDDVLCVSYSDDFQSYVQRKAFETGGGGSDLHERSAGLARTLGSRMAQSLASADIRYDIFMHSGDSPSLIPALRYFVDAADRQNLLTTAPQTVPFSDVHQVWGYEAFARGTCPNCGASTDTSQCESCAFPPSIPEMTDLRFVLDGSRLDMVKRDQIMLSIGTQHALLEDLFARMSCRPPLAKFGADILRSLPDTWAISRPGDWGPELPERPGQTLHTWFGGIAGYLAASMDWAIKKGKVNEWKHYWEDDKTEIVHFVGIDCAFSHTVVYPILLSSVGDGAQTSQVFTNQFLTLNGDGFSTSRGHAIWAGDFFSQVDSDAARLYLALVAPELEEADFDLAAFESFTNGVCYKILSNALSMVAKSRSNDGASGDSLTSDIAIMKLDSIRDNFLIATAVETFSMRGIANCVQDLLTLIYLSKADGLPQLLALYGCLAAALQPRFARSLREAIGVEPDWANDWLFERQVLQPTPMSAKAVAALGQVYIPHVNSHVIHSFGDIPSPSRHTSSEPAQTAAE
ncbi:MAG: class I tRNA ligase family protein [Pseudomonadota bacterium]